MSAPREKTRYPGIYKRGTRYSFTYRDNRGRQRFGSAATLAEAKVAKSAMQADVARGEFRALSRVTFGEYAPEWIRSYTGRTRHGVGPDTLADYRKALGLDDAGNPTRAGALGYFGPMRLTEIEPRHVREYAAQLASRPKQRGKGTLSPDTVRLALAPVKALLATAVEDGLIRANPTAGLRNLIPAPVVDLADDEDEDGDVKALREDELAALLARLPERWRLFHEFLAQTGLRIGEAIEVRHRDLDLGGQWLHVRRRFYRGRVAKPKGRKTRRVRLTEEMARSLWTQRKETRAHDDDLVFTADKGGRIDQSNLMSRVLKRAARDAGVGDWVGFHTFRHTCATMLFRRGWNAVQVQKFLGHSDPGFTLRRYIHLLDADLPAPNFGEFRTYERRNSSRRMSEPPWAAKLMA